ncbi:MAG TPA: hypothetical protein PL125_05200 [Candidatus Omnitrophota bacterium]|nr:hypothetical protein [Candidatus Omnitrophota bacterium]
MNNKWLIVLFILLFSVLALSFLIIRRSQKAVVLSEQEILTVEQTANRIPPVYSAAGRQASSLKPIAALPAGTRGITIVYSPSAESGGKSIPVSKSSDKYIKNTTSSNVASNVTTKDSLPTGITKAGKQPTSKETQEMNSHGVILY